MSVEFWDCILLVLFLTRVRSVRSGFSPLPQQSESWTAFYSLDQNDCNGLGKHRRFPEFYEPENDVRMSIGAPVNLTTTYLVRRYPGHRWLFPGIVVEFDPPEHGAEHIEGYEILLTKVNGTLCIVLNLVADLLVRQERVKIELYPLSSKTPFRVRASTLPLYNDGSQRSQESRIMTGRHGRLPDPVFWVTDVSYEVIRIGEERSLDVIFSSPPPQFGFHRFEVALLPADEGETGIQIMTIDACYHTFRNVTLGRYKLQIRPVDDFFSVPGRCLCHYTHSGMCSTCLTTEVQAFTIS